MSKWKIRPAAIDDAPAISDLILICAKLFILPDFNEEAKQHFISDNSLAITQERIKDFESYVAEDIHRKIIGFVALRKPSHLFSLFVAPSAQGEGLGRALWEQVSHCVSTVNSSRYALPFYKKLGFIGDEKKIANGIIYYPLARQN